MIPGRFGIRTWLLWAVLKHLVVHWRRIMYKSFLPSASQYPKHWQKVFFPPQKDLSFLICHCSFLTFSFWLLETDSFLSKFFYFYSPAYFSFPLSLLVWSLLNWAQKNKSSNEYGGKWAHLKVPPPPPVIFPIIWEWLFKKSYHRIICNDRCCFPQSQLWCR